MTAGEQLTLGDAAAKVESESCADSVRSPGDPLAALSVSPPAPAAKRMRFKRLYGPGGKALRDVGINRDGSLHNPNGYDQDVVREAVAREVKRRQRPKPVRWYYLYHQGRRLDGVGLNADGTLWNPNGHPEDAVRAAVAGALERARERRLEGARQAVQTRRDRAARRYYDTASQIVAGKVYGPADTCACCGRGLDDTDSVARGVGSECWPRLAELCNRIRARIRDTGSAGGYDDWHEAITELTLRSKLKAVTRPKGTTE